MPAEPETEEEEVTPPDAMTDQSDFEYISRKDT